MGAPARVSIHGMVAFLLSDWTECLLSNHWLLMVLFTPFTSRLDWLPYRKWGFPVISGLRGMSKIRTCGTWIFSPLLYLLSYHTKCEVETLCVVVYDYVFHNSSNVTHLYISFLKGTTQFFKDEHGPSMPSFRKGPSTYSSLLLREQDSNLRSRLMRPSG